MEPKPFAELLQIYYRQVERDCDMVFLATNFGDVFEPSATFNPAEALQGVHNRTGIADEELYNLALEMRATEPGDVLGYCQKWVAFQERWTEVMPTLPIYSNVYFDFYTPTLHNYNAGADTSWRKPSWARTSAMLRRRSRRNPSAMIRQCSSTEKFR